MRFSITLLLFIFNSLIVYSQQISGRVIDAETGKPLVKVNVYTSNTEIGTFTNKAGYFKLNFSRSPQADEVIYFTHIGYKTQEYSLSELNDAKFMIKMIEDTTPLDEVNLLSKYQLRSHLKFKSLPSMPMGIYATNAVLIDSMIFVYGGDISNKVEAFGKTMDSNLYLDMSTYSEPRFSLLEMLKKASIVSLGSFEGYNNQLQVFDISQNKWTVEKTNLSKRAYHNLIYSKNNKEIYIIGGKTLSPNRKFQYLQNEIDIIDLKNDTILTDKTNPHQAVNFASFISEDYVVIMGGSIKRKHNGEKVYSDKIHMFNTRTGLWYELGNMPQAKETSGVLIRNSIYLIGGYNGEALPYVEKYNLETNKWLRLGKLKEPVSRPALAYDNNSIYIYHSGNLSVFNLKTGIINEYALQYSTYNAQMVCFNNKLYIFGGYRLDDYDKERSGKMISIDLRELSYTQIKHSVKLNKTI